MPSTPAVDAINLTDLRRNRLGLTSALGQVMEEMAAVCFQLQQHACGVIMSVDAPHVQSSVSSYPVYWEPITEHQLRAYGDPQEATEYGATGVAILLMEALTPFTVLCRSVKGTGFDYWLSDQSGEWPFQNAARLEISGTLSDSERELRDREKRKLAQVSRTDGALPAYVVVVGFGAPRSRIARKQ
jgi:hypothetical protein